MNDVVIPTCGRVVHYFPNGVDPIAASSDVEKNPADVIRTTGLKADLSIKTLNEMHPIVVRGSVPHLSEVNPETATAYWDWPEIKK